MKADPPPEHCRKACLELGWYLIGHALRALFLLNNSLSRNPTRVRANTQRHIQAPREPLNAGVCLRVCALSQDRT
jgi:hypothetical protein